MPLLTAACSVAQILNLTDAVNKARRQRMLARRAAKAYFAIVIVIGMGMGISVPKAKDTF